MFFPSSISGTGRKGSSLILGFILRSSLLVPLFLTSVALLAAATPTSFARAGDLSTSLDTELELESGKIELSYRSGEGELAVTYSMGGRQERFVLSSEERLGVLISVSGKAVTYTVHFLEENEKWEPEKETGSRMTLSQKPGWGIVLMEQIGTGGRNSSQGGRG